MHSEKAVVDETEKCQIITLPNTLKKKIGFATAMASQAMVTRAEEAVEDIKVFHTEWLNDDVTALNMAFKAFESSPTEQSLTRLYRASHDLRGQALLFDYPLISRIAHMLCDLIESFADVSRPPLMLMNVHIQSIRVLLRDQVKNIDNRLALEMIHELEQKDQIAIALDKSGSRDRML